MSPVDARHRFTILSTNSPCVIVRHSIFFEPFVERLELLIGQVEFECFFMGRVSPDVAVEWVVESDYVVVRRGVEIVWKQV